MYHFSHHLFLICLMFSLNRKLFFSGCYRFERRAQEWKGWDWICSNMEHELQKPDRGMIGDSAKSYCCNRFQIKSGFSAPWVLIQRQSPNPEPESAQSNLCSLKKIKGFAQSLWLKQAGKVRNARYIWFAATAQRVIHWWCSWSVRAYRGTSHLFSLCPTTSKPFLLSGMSPLWINLVTREKERLPQNKIHWSVTWKQGAILETVSDCVASLIIRFFLETKVALSYRGNL